MFCQQNRKQNGRKKTLWIYGRHSVLAAIANPARQCKTLLVTADLENQVLTIISDVKRDRRYQPRIEIVDRLTIENILPKVQHQGIAVEVFPLQSVSVEAVTILASHRQSTIVVLLDHVTDPHNIGAVIRSSVVFGATAVVTEKKHAPSETGVLARAASGALERIPLVRSTNLVRALQKLKLAGFWSVGLAADATTPITTILQTSSLLPGHIAIVLGSEDRGIRRVVRASCDFIVCLPTHGVMKSLNVSNAAAVALYEIRRSYS